MRLESDSLLAPEDLAALGEARILLENASFPVRVAGALGQPVEWGLRALPARVSTEIDKASRRALHAALAAAVKSLGDRTPRPPRRLLHGVGVAAAGAAGGFFGLPGLLVELPFTTTVILRSIADIARAHGEDLATGEARAACLEVFALGGRAAGDDASESAYLAIRAALAQTTRQAADHLAERGLTGKGAPALVRLVSQVAQRFGIQVSEKVAAQAVPVIGAAGGGLINVIFIRHFQDMAKGHFTVRRLERRYGKEIVERAYAALPSRRPEGR